MKTEKRESSWRRRENRFPSGVCLAVSGKSEGNRFQRRKIMIKGTTALGLINERGYILVHDGKVTEYDDKFFTKPGQSSSPKAVLTEFCRKRVLLSPRVHAVFAGDVGLAKKVCTNALARSEKVGHTSVQDVASFIGASLLAEWANYGPSPCGLIIGGFEEEEARMMMVDISFHGKKGEKKPVITKEKLISGKGKQFVTMAHGEKVDRCLDGYTFCSTLEDTGAMIQNAMREGAKADEDTGNHVEAVLYTHDGQFYNIFTTKIEGMNRLATLGVDTSKGRR